MLRTLAVKPKLALDCALDYRVSREAMSESVKPAMVCVGKIHVSLMKKKKNVFNLENYCNEGVRGGCATEGRTGRGPQARPCAS